MSTLSIHTHGDNAELLGLPWDQPLAAWDIPEVVDLPKGISRHEVRFVRLDRIYAVKELPTRAARQDFSVLGELQEHRAPSVVPVALVEGRSDDPTEERSAALVTEYEDFSFSFRELLEGPGFGRRRNQLLAALAGLLVELHVIGCFWGDCSLSNVLYRYDASEIRTIMVDAETSKMVPALSDGQRNEDLEIMEINVAGGMSDIAASQGIDLDHADIHLGAQIRERYEWLWNAVNRDVVIAPDERWRVVERINELNDLGFTVDELELDEVDDGSLVRLHTTVGTRRFHADRLSELTAVQATEWQARHILSDLYHYRSLHQADKPGVSALRWRVDVLEPMLQRMGADRPGYDPIQQYCDFLHFRYEVSRQRGLDIDNEAAYVEWADQGYPGFPLEDTAD